MKITAVLNWNLLTVLVLASIPTVAADYDPLAVPKSGEVRNTDLTVRDEARKRDVPLRVCLPATTEPAQVVIFSHGLGGSRENNPYLGTHSAARGYVAVFLQHPGSDVPFGKTRPHSACRR